MNYSQASNYQYRNQNSILGIQYHNQNQSQRPQFAQPWNQSGLRMNYPGGVRSPKNFPNPNGGRKIMVNTARRNQNIPVSNKFYDRRAVHEKMLLPTSRNQYQSFSQANANRFRQQREFSNGFQRQEFSNGFQQQKFSPGFQQQEFSSRFQQPSVQKLWPSSQGTTSQGGQQQFRNYVTPPNKGGYTMQAIENNSRMMFKNPEMSSSNQQQTTAPTMADYSMMQMMNSDKPQLITISSGQLGGGASGTGAGDTSGSGSGAGKNVRVVPISWNEILGDGSGLQLSMQRPTKPGETPQIRLTRKDQGGLQNGEVPLKIVSLNPVAQ